MTATPLPSAGRPVGRSGGTVAVVVTYRCAGDAVDCLASLAAACPGVPVVVVDNASGDGTSDAVRAWAASAATASTTGGVTVIDLPQNLGFGAGCNRGIERALADDATLRHVLLVNPDCVVEPGCLEELRGTAGRHPGTGIVGGKILSLDGRSVWFEHGAWKPWTLGSAHVPAPSTADEHEAGFVTGALMLVDGDLLREGLRFDERYFLYCEDVDFCREAVRRGRTLRVNRRATARHRGAGSQGGAAKVVGDMNPLQLRCITRNKVWLARRWLSLPQFAVFCAVVWVARPVSWILRYRRVAFLPAYFRALAEGHFTSPGSSGGGPSYCGASTRAVP